MEFRATSFLRRKWRRITSKYVILGVVLSFASVYVTVLYFGYVPFVRIPWTRSMFTTIHSEVRNDVHNEVHNAIHNISVYERVTKKPNPLACLSGLVFARHAPARLGNRLMEYASAWSIGKLYNMTPVVTDTIFKSVIPLFTGLSVTPASKAFKDLRKIDAICADLAEKSLQNGKPTSVEPWDPDKMNTLKKRGPVILRPYIILPAPIISMRAALKEEFTYRPEFLVHAESVLRNASSDLAESAASERQIVYVGVHVRRTDYHRYLGYKFGLKEGDYAKTDYYVHAMQYILRRLSEKGNLKVVFAVTGDDEKWGRKEMIPALENELRSRNLLKTNATVSWCGSSSFQNDLVMLSSCNHSIIAYGTFATWSSLMAGGMTVVFDIDPDGKRQKSNAAMNFATLIPDWIKMH